MEHRLEYLENALKNTDEQLRELLLARLELSYDLAVERASRGISVWDVTRDSAVLAGMTAELPQPQAQVMYQVWSIMLREERQQYFLGRNRVVRP